MAHDPAFAFVEGLLITLVCFDLAEALYCLSCTNSVSPRHCHVVRKCDVGEVCFTESHTSENGVLVYDTGCASSQTCRARRGHHQLKSLSGVDPHYHHSLCRDCCSTNLCNTQGCGQQGYPLSRGPVCFDCRQVADATLCDQIRVCEPNQACYLQREQEFGDTFYTSSCINKHACSSHIDIFGRRSLGRCPTCCLADLCNNQCGDVTSSTETAMVTATETTKTTAATTAATTTAATTTTSATTSSTTTSSTTTAATTAVTTTAATTTTSTTTTSTTTSSTTTSSTTTAATTTTSTTTSSTTTSSTTTTTATTAAATATTTTTTTSPTPSTTEEPVSTGSRGREFLILFMRNWEEALGSLSVYITTDNTSSVNITSSSHLNANIKSAVNRNASITSNSEFTLPFNLTCEYSKIEPKAVMLQTAQLSTVTIFDSFSTFTNDGTLIIPTDKLSNQYIISTTEPRFTTTTYYSQFAVGAFRDRTVMKIKFKMVNNVPITLLGRTYGDGDVFSVTLDRLETFQIGHTTDLSGTFIASTKPIAVFSGNRCNQMMKSYGCSQMVMQLPPITELDHQFIVPPFFHNSKTLIQVLTPTLNTINVTNGGAKSSWVLKEMEFKNLKSTHTAVIVSRQPILVTDFGMGSSSFHVHPYMTVIPGVHQYLDYYKITVPAGYTENFLCIIIPAPSVNNLQINGFSRDHYNTVYQSSVSLDVVYSVRVLKIQNTGETFVLSTSDKSKFGLIVYGHREWDGFGFAGNFVLA